MHVLHTRETWAEETALPQMPASPTLTNPEHILPSTALPTDSSPPRVTRRPPSPTYLRHHTRDVPGPHGSMGRKEKPGYAPKKMLLRTRVHASVFSDSNTDTNRSPTSPILLDPGNLASLGHPSEQEHLQLPQWRSRSASGGSFSSEISGLTGFLGRYPKSDENSDDETLYDNADTLSVTYPKVEGDDEVDAERRRQQQEEYNSAILSQRAEQILANAKKRLNVMEGNLRGARDLMAPLTAANLKRATSLGSADYATSYAHLHIPDPYLSEDQSQRFLKVLHSQSSSPSIAREYQGHGRNFSDVDLPGRPYTSMDDTRLIPPRKHRHSAQRKDAVPTHAALRARRSHDSLASGGAGYGGGYEHALRARDSAGSGCLEPLPEHDEARKSDQRNPHHKGYPVNNGLGIYRPSSRTSDLREQMSSLKGKISTLTERAREDSLRRQSQSSLRDPSPLNNALAAAPEFFYSPPSSQDSPVFSDADAGWNATNPIRASQEPPSSWERSASSRTSSYNQGEGPKPRKNDQAHADHVKVPKTPDSKFQVRPARHMHTPPDTVHQRTASGTAIVDSAASRFSHRQHTPRRAKVHPHAGSRSADDNTTTIEDEDDFMDTSSELSVSPVSSTVTSNVEQDVATAADDNDDDVSVYEYARADQNPVVAHEDREDAFDYEHFFLHSAMVAYKPGRRGSDSSEVSASSVETAKGPALAEQEDYDRIEDDLGLLAGAPETPERLRMIERNLHKRALSIESVSTVDSFVTVDEMRDDSPEEELGRNPRSSRRTSTSAFAQTASRNASRSAKRSRSRPTTAVKPAIRRHSSSDRADSGVGIGSHDGDQPRAAAQPALSGPKTPKRRSARADSSSANTPPGSPFGPSRQDPVTVAVSSLLDPKGKPLGLRNKAVLFGVMESLKRAVHQMQEDENPTAENPTLRKRMEEARQVLDGLAESF